ncbi:MAG: sigma-70 family RNA polymerase sigma factor [Verrucomicrobiales bacterium]|nr:sigma-70 family RNA polymerase sigma factor [Verrucomicrobiales bacterium]
MDYERKLAGGFSTTHWSVVLAAQRTGQPVSLDALGALYATYRYPIYAFIRRKSFEHHTAQDLTDEFFSRLIEKDWLKEVAPEKGRFRSFLLAAVGHFLSKEYAHQHRQKRGGNSTFVSWDELNAEQRFEAESVPPVQTEKLFDRDWAVAAMRRVRENLQGEYERLGRSELHAALRPHLTCDGRPEAYARLAAKLSMSEAAIKMAALRMRRRLRDLLRQEVAQTVDSPDEVDEEIRYLLAVLEA